MQLLTPYGLLVAVANAQYALQSSFSGLTFFENFVSRALPAPRVNAN